MINLGYGPNNSNLETVFKDIHINDYLKPVQINKVNNLLIENLETLNNIIDFNIRHNIKTYCVSDYLIPHAGFYNLEDLPDWNQIENQFYWIGHKINANNISICIKMSDRQGLSYTKKKGQQKIWNRHITMGILMDLLEQPQNQMAPIIINSGYHYNYLEGSLKRAHKVAKSFPESFYNRCAITNSLFDRGYNIDTLLDLHSYFPKPIAFNVHHYRAFDGNLVSKEKEFFIKSIDTWEYDPFVFYGEPINGCHYSQLVRNRITSYDEIGNRHVKMILKSHQNELSVFNYLRKYPENIQKSSVGL